MDLYKKHQANSVSGDYNNSKYQLEINIDENWEETLQQYLNFNVFGEDKVTVVVPIYNTADYLSRCVKSITSQTYRNLEILLIVDGATDKSLDICNMMAEQDPRIRVIYQQNMGLAETRNQGIKHATGEYIFFLDSDDFIDSDDAILINEVLDFIEPYSSTTLLGFIHNQKPWKMAYYNGRKNISNEELREFFKD